MEKHPIEDITLAQLNFPSNHKVGDRQTVQAVFQNHGEEYSREVHLFASPTADKGEHLCRTQVTIAEGGETVSAFTFTPDVAGTWNIWLTNDWDGNDVVGQGTVEITAEGIASSHQLRYASHTVNNRSNGVVYGNCMQGKVTILNQGDEVFDGVVRLWLFKEAAGGGFFGEGNQRVDIDGGTAATQQVDTAAFDKCDAPGLAISNKAQLLAVVPQGHKAILHNVCGIILVAQ